MIVWARPCLWCSLCPMQCYGELSTRCSSRFWSFTAHLLTKTWPLSKNVSQRGWSLLSWNVMCRWVRGAAYFEGSDCLHLQDTYTRLLATWRWRHYSPLKWWDPLTAICFPRILGTAHICHICTVRGFSTSLHLMQPMNIPWIHKCV